MAARPKTALKGTSHRYMMREICELEPAVYKMIACGVMARECYTCAAVSKNTIDLTIIRQGLHDVGAEKMSAELQAAIDAVDVERYQAILLLYGLCSNGITGLQARIPLVIPRAHDCITLLLGSKDAYNEHFNAQRGTFYSSVGWIERAKDNLDNPDSTTRAMGMGTYEEYVAKYGERRAKMLQEMLGNPFRNYSQLDYIDTGVPNTESLQEKAKDWAAEQGWEYSELDGSRRLIMKLMDGEWDEEEFLIVQPGQGISASYGDEIISAIQVSFCEYQEGPPARCLETGQ